MSRSSDGGRLVELIEGVRGLEILLDPALDHHRGFFHLGELTHDLTDRLKATSTLSLGYLWVAATAMPDTMYCNGMPSGFGLSGCSQASVQSSRSIRAGFR